MYMKKQSSELFLDCACHGESVLFKYDEDGYLNVSFYRQGYQPVTRSWKEKLRWIWYILTHDIPYGDQVLFDSQRIKALKNFLK